MIKGVMMLREGIILPQPGMSHPLNSKFPPLDKMNVHIPDKTRVFKAYPTGDGKRKLILNNFDAAVRPLNELFENDISDCQRAVILAFSSRILLPSRKKERTREHTK